MKIHHLACLPLLTLSLACSRDGATAAPDLDLLPAPSREGWQSDGAWPGFTLVAPLRSKWMYLVDMSGTAVHEWETAATPGVAVYLTERGTLLRCYQVEDHPIFRGGGQGGWVQELDWDGTVLWDFRWDSEEGLQHHDIEELPNGNVLIIAWDRHTRAEALARGRDPELLEGEEFWPGAVYEIRPTRPEGGEVVWSWHSWDHLVQDFDPGAPSFGDPAEHPERIDINGDRDPEPPTEAELAAEEAQMAALGYAGDDGDDAGDPGGGGGDAEGAEDDAQEAEEDPEEAALKARTKGADWMHTNGIDYNAELDQIALSVRRFDEVWILDHSTTTAEAAGSTGGRSGKGGDILYRWGNPFAYGMGAWEDRQLFGQHHVQWIPAGHLGAGNLIVFNNGSRRLPEPDDEEAAEAIDKWSSVDEWWALRDAAGNYWRAPGEPFGPREPDWRYEAPNKTDFYSSFISGVQRLPNGNTLVCSGAQGRVFELTPRGTTVWEWSNPYGYHPDEEPKEDADDDEVPTALFRAERHAPDSPGIVALRDKGAAVPLDPGKGPATHQRVDPPPEEEAPSGR